MKPHSHRSGARHLAICAVGACALVPHLSAAQSITCASRSGVGNYDAAVISSVTGQVEIFYGMSTGNLIRMYGDPRAPASLTAQGLGGEIASEPSAVSWGSGHSAVFVRGTNAELWYLQWDNGSATGWTSLGGQIVWNPSAVSESPGQIAAFFRGTNQALWYKEFSGGTWSGFQTLGGVLTSSPVAVSWGPGHMAVFTRGQANDLWYRQRLNGTWGPWVGLGGSFGVDPAVVSRGAGLIDVFVRSGNAVQKISYNGSSWSGWQNIGGPPAGAVEEPGAAATTAGALVAFVRSANTYFSPDPNPHRPIYSSTSTDGGITWGPWIFAGATNAGSSSKVNPEAAGNGYGGYTVTSTNAYPGGGELQICSSYY